MPTLRDAQVLSHNPPEFGLAATNRHSVPQHWKIVALVLVAALTGITVAYGQWTSLAVISAAILVFWRPVEVSLGLFAFMIPFDSIAVIGSTGIGTTLTWFVGAAAAVVLATTGLIGRRFQRPPAATLWWGLFAAWAVLAAGWAVDPALVLGRLPTLGGFFLLYVAVTCLRFTGKELSWVCLITVAGGVAAAVYASYQYYHGNLYASHDLRATMLLGSRQEDPNYFASTLLVPMALAIGGFLCFKDRKRILGSLLATLILGLSIFLTSSRGALVGVLAIFVFFWLRTAKIRRLGLCAALVSPLIFFMPSTFFERVEEAAATGGAGRWYVWQAGFQALKHYGAFGAGLDNFSRVYQKYAGYAPRFWGSTRSAHNVYLSLAVEVGIIGLAILLRAFVLQFRESKRATSLPDLATTWVKPLLWSLEAACWSMLASGMFLDLFWRKQFWFAWMMLAAATRFAQNQAKLQDTGTRTASIRLRPWG